MIRLLVLSLTVILSGTLASVTVDLREPVFSEGILQTEQGGVVTAPNLRIQADKIRYCRQVTEEGVQESVEAKGSLIIEYGEYIITGESLAYDFAESRGIICNGRTGIPPWFVGGREIHLCPDGSYLIYDGFATTSESRCPDWKIEAEKACLSPGRNLSSHNMRLNVFRFPLLWIPRFRMNLDTIFHSPFRYTFRCGGAKGTRFGVSYDAFNWRGWKARLMLDYRINRGLGGGVELDYKSPARLERFHAVNYLAEGTTISNDKKRTRYRYMGVYSNTLHCGKTTINGSYDFLSDKEMASDYADKGLRLETGKPTQIEARHQEPDWIVSALGRFRANKFQTVKQELPTVFGTLRPFVLGNSGIVSENSLKLSYLEQEFTDDRPDQKDYNAPRYEVSSNLYRPLKWGQFNITPQAGIVAIYYGNNSEKLDRWVTTGLFELDVNTDLYRFYKGYKHVITPYARYSYYTYPETSPKDHFIFDLDDGWFRLNMLKLGVVNNLYTKRCGDCIYRKLYADLFLIGFFDTKTIPEMPYKTYTRIVYNATPFLRNTLTGGWDIERNRLDHINYRIDWTINTSAAVAAEYRHRSPFDWRKVDRMNFILDSFADPRDLLDSDISDQRDTLLLHLYYKFHPSWALGAQSRSGWNRKSERNYSEFQLDLLGRFQSSLNLKISYRHKVDDDRFSVNFSIGQLLPGGVGPPTCSPCLEF